jgi:hypothetical protein
MSSYGILRVGSIVVSQFRDGVGNELMAVFRDDMLCVSRCSIREYEIGRYGSSDVDTDYEEQIEVTEFRAPGQVIADRLDTIGIDAATALAYLDEGNNHESPPTSDAEYLAALDEDARRFVEEERDFRRSISARRWVDLLSSSADDPPGMIDRSKRSRHWLLDILTYMDERFALRLVLLAFPHDEVVLDVTDIEEGGWVTDVGRIASDAALSITGMAGMHAPVVVLTEGRTDAEFLRAGLRVLYPHLTDLIRFLDYEGRPEGGVGALVRMIRAFAAAGIVNRVIAIFDNDTAASDVLRTLDMSKVPDQIKVVRYPYLKLAESYPTLGPPTIESPTGSVSLANINGGVQ